MTKEYDDIINLPRHISRKRSPMSIINRAAQFSPFAALTGHDEAVKETARLTDNRIELDEYMKVALNDKLQISIRELEKRPKIKITYFQPDEIKKGGAYIAIENKVKKIDEYKQLIYMVDGTIVPIKDVISIEGKIFESKLF